MEGILEGKARARRAVGWIPLAKGIGWGVIGGLASTVVMDLVLMSMFAAAGLPALTCFSMIGATLAGLFSLPITAAAGVAALGAGAHYVIGPLIGAIFGAAVVRVPALRAVSLKKSILLAVVYVEIISQPILATTPIILKMSAAQTLQWFGGSFCMHLVWAIVLGAVVSRGLGWARAESVLRGLKVV